MLKFFLNPSNSAHLRGLEHEFGESSNAIRIELNRLQDANMLKSELQGNKKLFSVNQQHPLYGDINNIVKKYFGLDVIVESIANRLGELKAVYLTGDIARGKDSDLIDLILIGTIDQNYLLNLVSKTEKLINRKIRYLIYSEQEFSEKDELMNSSLLVWGENIQMNGI